jgi:hypothetical protein
MENAFDAISRIESLMAAALVDADDNLLGWCANSAIDADTLRIVCHSAATILGVLAGQPYPAHTFSAAFGDKTLIARSMPSGTFIALLDSPANDEVLVWLWNQVEPALRQAGMKVEP